MIITLDKNFRKISSLIDLETVAKRADDLFCEDGERYLVRGKPKILELQGTFTLCTRLCTIRKTRSFLCQKQRLREILERI